jgi:hypothetical protein
MTASRSLPAPATRPYPADFVVLEGEPGLLSTFQDPLRRALGARRAPYRVNVDWVGRCGEIMVSITGAKGRLPLLFSRDQMDPGFVHRVVHDTVERYGF